MTDGLNVVWSNDRAAPTDTNPKNLELAPPQSVTATRLDQLVYSPNYYIQIFQTQPFARSEDWTLNLHARSYQIQRAYQLCYGSYTDIEFYMYSRRIWVRGQGENAPTFFEYQQKIRGMWYCDITVEKQRNMSFIFSNYQTISGNLKYC